MSEERPLTDANIQVLQLSDSDVKSAIRNMLQQATENSLKTNEKIENLSKEREVIKKEPSRNYRTKKYSNRNKILAGWAQ